jgi:aquaporin related protein
MPGRSSLDAHQTARDDLLARGYSLYYDGDFEATSRRPRVYVSDSEAGFYGGGGGGGGRPPPPPEAVMRLPWTMWMNSSAKNHFVAFIGEFVGTTMFLFFAFAGTQVANIGAVATSDRTTTGAATGFSPTVLLYIAVVFGFSLMVNVWIFFRISGGLFNPAVTFAMLLCRAVSPVRATLLLVAQLAGSIFSSFLVSVMFPTSFNVRTTLSPGTSIVRGVFIEAILTAELVFTIFMLAKEKHKGTPFYPLNPKKEPRTNPYLSNLHCPRRHRPLPLHRRARWRLLHGRLAEPRAQLRPLRRNGRLRRRALDLLGWTRVWRHRGRHLLQVHQDARVRGREPGAG